jgi:putative membrane protein
MSDLNDPRVLFAAERTLLAWNRTSVTLMAFGFVVERSGLLLKLLTPDRISDTNETGAFWLGLAFIFLGAVAAAYSSRQYALLLKTLSEAEFPAGYVPKWGLVVNSVVAVMGVLLIAVLYFGRV